MDRPPDAEDKQGSQYRQKTEEQTAPRLFWNNIKKLKGMPQKRKLLSKTTSENHPLSSRNRAEI